MQQVLTKYDNFFSLKFYKPFCNKADICENSPSNFAMIFIYLIAMKWIKLKDIRDNIVTKLRSCYHHSLQVCFNLSKNLYDHNSI